jgi:hypothetical protein
VISFSPERSLTVPFPKLRLGTSFILQTHENGKILTEARYRFDVLTEPEVSNDPGNSDSPPTVPEELMDLFQSEIYESDDSSVSVVPPLLLL